MDDVSKGKKDIVRLRTFADDVSRVREQTGTTETVAAEISSEDAQPSTTGVFLKIKKKPLNIKDSSQVSTPLDEDGISFNEETAAKVEDQAYEEHQSVKEAEKIKEDVVRLSPTDTIESITKAPKQTKPETETVQKKEVVKPAPPVSTKSPIPKKPAAPAPTKVVEAAEDKKIKLSKEDTIDQISAPLTTTLNRSGIVHEVKDNDLSDGEIVSDKKRKRFKLVPAMGEALTDWFGETKDQIEEATKEKHTIKKTEGRVETIKAAARKKTLVPDEDFQEVAERLKHTKKVDQKGTSVVVKPKETKEASWSHTIPETPEEIEAAKVTNATIETPKVTPESAETKALKTKTINLQTQLESAKASESYNIQSQTEVSVTQKESIQTTAPVPPKTEPANISAEPVTPPTPVITADEKNTDSLGSRMSKMRLPKFPGTAKKESAPSPVMALVVVIIAIASGIGTSMYFFWQPTEEPSTIPVATTRPLFTAQLQTEVPFTTDHASTLRTLQSAVNSNSDTLYLYFTETNTNALVSPTDTMSFLAPQTPGSFIRSVTNISFGSMNSKPFIVLQVNNFDNAFSGMLAWEQTMSADLAPLFGSVVTESFDPQARTTEQTRSAFFRDIITSNLSSRLLADKVGDDRIVYAFADKETIIIATDRLQLTDILPLVR